MARLSIFVLVSLGLLFFQNCSNSKFSQKVSDSGLLENGNENGIDNNSTDPNDPNDPNDPDEGIDPIGTEIDFPDGTIVRLPTLGEYASIAFEDNVNAPNAGDRDYNDAVFNYRIEEIYTSDKKLARILVEVILREKIAGNNHRLFLYLNGNPTDDFSNITATSQSAINGLADIKVIDPQGQEQLLLDQDHFLAFPATTGMKNKSFSFEINLKSPDLNQVGMIPSNIDFRKYRFVLQNHGQSEGIDLSEINSTDEMVAQDGYPLGFMIPTDWSPPPEGQLIDNKYPNFHLYRNWLNGNQSNPLTQQEQYWFL